MSGLTTRRASCTLRGRARGAGMLEVVLAVPYLLAVIVDGGSDVSNTETTAAAHHATNNELRTSTLHDAEVARVKLLKSPKKTLENWHKDGFAFPEKRAPDFEALRVDKMEGWGQPPRVHRRNISPDEFRSKFEANNQTVVIEGIAELVGWEAADWTLESLARHYPDMLVMVGTESDLERERDVLQMTMADFERYAQTNVDDNPLYVFDYEVYEDDAIGKGVMSQYSVPDLFPEDLFSVVNGDEEYPAYRWLLVGPKRSGSFAHTDPLGTSAWNTLFSGRKLWFLAPPELKDQFRPATKKHGEPCHWFADVLPNLLEAHKDKVLMYVQHPGETMFVPAYWIHAVLNLDDTVAVTQNFVSWHNFPGAWVQTRQDLPRFALRWLQALVHVHPELAALALELGVEQDEDEDEDRYAYYDDDDDDLDVEFDYDYDDDDDDDDVEWEQKGLEL